jgi:hypothetical protein
MLLEHGNTDTLQSRKWYMLELVSETDSTIEATLSRITRSIPQIFTNHPVQLFIPVLNRDLNRFDIQSGPYIFVRSNSLEHLSKMKRILGVVGLLTESDTGYMSRLIEIEDSYVQRMMEELRHQQAYKTSKIKKGSFVRILAGQLRDYCGTVTAITNQRATVAIQLNSKSITLDTPTSNLLPLELPNKQRKFYYSPELSK